MKKSLALILCGLIMLLAACSGGSKPTSSGVKNEKVVKVGISQLVEHPSLDAAREGFIAALKDAGYVEGKNLKIDYQNAQGDVNTNMSIAQKLVGEKNDLILAIATSSAQAVVKST
ncbi:MAG: ABC transporter substrate binding protein, partial [Bacillota bacterium]|nr:ABC transporter substrate binding protein [Bacillota bacterium]